MILASAHLAIGAQTGGIKAMVKLDKADYWSYTEAERSLMTGEDVEALIRFELMQKGVIRLEEPHFDEVVDIPLSKSDVWFSVAGLLFREQEQAQTVADMNPHKSEYDYRIGYHVQYASPHAEHELKVSRVALHSEADVAQHRSALERAKSTKEENEKKRNEWKKNAEEVSKATNGLWDDWHNCRNCRNLRSRYERIVSTFNQYKEMTNDDGRAMFFLQRVFGIAEIVEAGIWLDHDVLRQGTAIMPDEEQSLPQPLQQEKTDDDVAF